MEGYTGKILRVKFGENQLKVESLDENLGKEFIGGSGLAAKILYAETGPETSPLGPENRLIFMTGPFAATPVITSSRHAVVTKSPLTGIFGESDSGGTWGAMLKKAGFDGIVIEGRSDRPVYLWISEGKAEIREAKHLWGRDTYEVDELIRKETKQDAVVASIGPAGEKLVRFASILTNGKDARAAGRTGVGAVMGSKNLKAIALHGTQNVKMADPDTLRSSLKEISPVVAKNAEGMRKFGTAGGLPAFEALGSLPLQNWKFQGRWEQSAGKIAGATMTEKILTGNYYCDRCVIGCGRRVKVDQGPYAGVEGAGPEYESIAFLGSSCLVDDLEAIAKANELCNRYGMDTISTGAAIAFAMEAYEKGLIGKKETCGVDLLWGRADAMVAMVEKIGRREGLGFLLGEGVQKAAVSLGGKASEFSLHVKGLEIPGHDPRAYNGGGLSFATSNRGACHLAGFTHVFERGIFSMPEIGLEPSQRGDGRKDPPMGQWDLGKAIPGAPPPLRLEVKGKGELAAKTQNMMSLYDALKICKFTIFGGLKLTTILNWYTYVTGVSVNIAEFLKIGERIFNLKRLYNVRCGVSRKDDILPSRLLTLKHKGDGLTPNLPHLGEMLSEYYEYRGWNEEGIPLPKKLKELGLDGDFLKK